MEETINQFSPETSVSDLKNRFGQATEKDLENIRVALLEFTDDQNKQIFEILKNDQEASSLLLLIAKAEEKYNEKQGAEIAAEDQERQDKRLEDQSSDLNR